MRTVLVTLIGPERTADLVVDAEATVGNLMPSLLAAGGVAMEDPGSEAWRIALTGKQPIERDSTLEDAGVLDGAVLVLRRDTDARPEVTVVTPPPTPPAGPTGSPLQRTRSLLTSATGSDGAAAATRRSRLLGQLPDPAGLLDGRDGGLENAVATTALRRCATIAIVSPKGGVGKTTLSILLGELLCSLRSDQVLALDADGDYGSLGRVMPARARAVTSSARDGSVFDALAEGAVTFAELDRTLWALPGGLRIVPSPRDPASMARTDREAYARVIGHLQRLAGVLLIDCGTGLGQPGVQAAIMASDQLVAVTDASGPTASLLAEAMQILERSGRPITVVCNRLRRGKAGSEDLARLDTMFPRARALVGVAADEAAERASEGDFEWPAAPQSLRRGIVELGAALALAWPELGLSPTA